MSIRCRNDIEKSKRKIHRYFVNFEGWIKTGFIYLQQDAPFHHIVYDCSRADCDGLRDHLRDVPWDDSFSFKLLLVNFGIGFRLELMYISPLVSISSNFTHFHGFQNLYQQNKSSESKVKFKQASYRCKRVLEAAKLAYATKKNKRVHHFQETWLSGLLANY